MKKYKDWFLLERLPKDWKIDKTVGSPVCGYEFCTNGKSVLNGQKRALVKVIRKNTPLAGMQCYNQPFVGGYFSPYKDGDCKILKLVKEDEQYYYFDDLTKYPKNLPWWWFKREKPIEIIENSEPFIFPYESYSLWSRQLAEIYSVNELQKVVDECEGLSDKYAKQHLSAIQATTSMQSQSQRRAHARNNVTGNYEKKRAYSNAIELHKYYPERCKRSFKGWL